MNILVTGASGKVAKYVARHLANQGHDVTNLDRIPPPEAFSDIPWRPGDILDPAEMRECVKGYDAVAHLAGVPTPLFHPGEEVIRINALGTYNVVEAAAANGVPRLALMSSESVLGFAFLERPMDPEFLPMDETHPQRPQDAYALSKVAAEAACQAAVRRTGIEICILRSPWVWVPEPSETALHRELVADPHKWHRSWWAFCGVEDVASAFALALTRPLQMGPPDSASPAPAYFISAADNWTGRDTLELAREHYNVPDSAVRGLHGARSPISHDRIRAELGWEPRQTAADFVGAEPASGDTAGGEALSAP